MAIFGIDYSYCCEHQTGQPAREKDCLVKPLDSEPQDTWYLLREVAYIIQAQSSCMASNTQPAAHSEKYRGSRKPDARVYWHPCYLVRVLVIWCRPFRNVRRCEVSNVTVGLSRASHVAVCLEDQYSRRLELLVSEDKYAKREQARGALEALIIAIVFSKSPNTKALNAWLLAKASEPLSK